MKKILLCLSLSIFLLLQGCSVIMALSGDKNPDFKVIAKGSSKTAIENQPIKVIFTEAQKNGNTIVKYKYTTGKERNPGAAAIYILLDGFTFFIAEFFTTPLEKSHAGTENIVTVEYNPQEEAVRVF